MTQNLHVHARRGFGLLAHLHWRLLRRRPEIDLLSICLIVIVSLLAGFGLMLNQGIADVFDKSGDGSTYVLLSRGSSSEAESFIGEETVNRLRAVLSGDGLRGLTYDEQLVISTSVEREATEVLTFVSLRGLEVQESARPLRHLVAGRMYRPGANEVIIGQGLARTLPEFALGRQIMLAQKSWLVVGIFSMEGDVRESEAAADLTTMRGRYGAEGLASSIRMQASAETAARISRSLEQDDQIELRFVNEKAFFRSQSLEVEASIRRMQMLVMAISIPATLLGLIAVQRVQQTDLRRKLGGLSFIGFRNSSIVASITVRTALLGIVAGALSALILGGLIAGRPFELDLGLQVIAVEFVARWPMYLVVAGVSLGISLGAGLYAGAEGMRHHAG